MKIKISVIVPVYNVEHYLSKCINSILNQTFKDFELILVNDGSTDNSLNICKKYLKKDNRIKIISKTNGGLSEARNYGLNKAIGKYVCFIDSDDFVEQDYLSELYHTSERLDADITICGFYTVDEEYKRIDTAFLNEPKDIQKMSGQNVVKYLYRENSTVNVVAWNKLYKRSLFENLRYEVGRFFEDEYMIVPVLWKAKNVSFVRIPLYNYLQRSDSIMHTNLNLKKVKDAIDFQKQRISFFHSVYRIDLEKLAIQNYRYSIIKLMMNDNCRTNPKLKVDLQSDFRKYNFSFKANSIIQNVENILGYIDIGIAARTVSFFKNIRLKNNLYNI